MEGAAYKPDPLTYMIDELVNERKVRAESEGGGLKTLTLTLTLTLTPAVTLTLTLTLALTLSLAPTNTRCAPRRAWPPPSSRP